MQMSLEVLIQKYEMLVDAKMYNCAEYLKRRIQIELGRS